jgi:hypothetical protein
MSLILGALELFAQSSSLRRTGLNWTSESLTTNAVKAPKHISSTTPTLAREAESYNIHSTLSKTSLRDALLPPSTATKKRCMDIIA